MGSDIHDAGPVTGVNAGLDATGEGVAAGAGVEA